MALFTSNPASHCRAVDSIAIFASRYRLCIGDHQVPLIRRDTDLQRCLFTLQNHSILPADRPKSELMCPLLWFRHSACESTLDERNASPSQAKTLYLLDWCCWLSVFLSENLLYCKDFEDMELKIDVLELYMRSGFAVFWMYRVRSVFASHTKKLLYKCLPAEVRTRRRSSPLEGLGETWP